MQRLARGGVDPYSATMTLAQYGDSIMPLAMRGLEPKTLDPYLAGWRQRVVPSLGHLPVRMITNGAVDRAVHGWIADECSRSTVKNSLADPGAGDGAGGSGRHHRPQPRPGHRLAARIPAGRGRAGRPARARPCRTGRRWSDSPTPSSPDPPTSSPVGRRGHLRRLHRRPHRRGLRRPGRRHRPRPWTLDRPPPDHSLVPAGSIDKGTKGKRARTVPLIVEVRADRSPPRRRRPTPTPGCSPGPRRPDQHGGPARRHPLGRGRRRRSATSTSAATICGTPG